MKPLLIENIPVILRPISKNYMSEVFVTEEAFLKKFSTFGKIVNISWQETGKSVKSVYMTFKRKSGRKKDIN